MGSVGRVGKGEGGGARSHFTYHAVARKICYGVGGGGA